MERRLACAVALAVAARAAAATELRVSVTPDACPSPKALAGALAHAVPGARVVFDPAGAIEVIDLGDRYRVKAAGRERQFVDRARRCDERARAAAVFVAIELERAPPAPTPPPPTTPAPPTVTPAPPTAAPAATMATPAVTRAPVAAAARSELHVDAEATGALAVDFGAQVAGGGAARFVASWRFLGVALGVGGLSTVTLPLDRGAATLSRVPLDLDARALVRRGRLEGAVDLGVALVALTASGQGFAVDRGATVLDVALRAALVGKLWLGERLALLASVETVAGRSRPLALADGAVVGATPPAWLTVALGVAVRIR